VVGLCALIIAIESIDERIADAKDLLESLKASDVLDEVSIHPALYWKDRSSLIDYLTRYPEHTFKESYLEDRPVGQLAATLSHISVWRKLLESQHDAAVVFEDDIYITDMERFDITISKIRENPNIEWARLHLHKNFRDRIVDIGRGELIDDPLPWGFAAYYVSRSGAEKLLAACNNIGIAIDHLPPFLRKRGALRSKTVTEVIVDHHAFDGDEAKLEGRHEIEKNPESLQKTASTVYTSPRLSNDAELRRFLSRLNKVENLRRDGVTVLRGVFDSDTIEDARKVVLKNRKLFKNTRPTVSSGHLASFHRFPELEPLHTLLTGNRAIAGLVEFAVGGGGVRSIGLSDITINRSQPWHVDLLRGKYSHYLDNSLSWTVDEGGVYKAILYLNDTDSLKVVRGSHLKPVLLDNDHYAEPGEDAEVASISVYAGDVVVMDLRCAHRGSDEAAYASGQWDEDPRILVSTVLGGTDRRLTKAMEIGNFFRLQDWLDRHP
jgi:GR25 family glycosyltransferase involved in LPS biosynthesis